MAARGTEAKNIVTEQILKTFNKSFRYEKEIRIPVMENGELVQIKVTLTAAKTNVENGGDVAMPGLNEPIFTPGGGFDEFKGADNSAVPEPSAEEKAAVEDLIKKLGF